MSPLLALPGIGQLIASDAINCPVILPHLLQPHAWFRRAGFSLTYPELLHDNERRVIALAMFDLAPSDNEIGLVEIAFRKSSARLAAGWSE